VRPGGGIQREGGDPGVMRPDVEGDRSESGR
jgi:hypothetical protein